MSGKSSQLLRSVELESEGVSESSPETNGDLRILSALPTCLIVVGDEVRSADCLSPRGERGLMVELSEDSETSLFSGVGARSISNSMYEK
jgi:hypothetical protein